MSENKITQEYNVLKRNIADELRDGTYSFANVDVELTDLVDIEIVQRMQNTFSKMARMASLTIDENGNPITETTDFSRMCTEYCRKSPEGAKRCRECNLKGTLQALETDKPYSFECYAHLTLMAAPICLGDKLLGCILGGQVVTKKPDENAMRQVAREIGVDEDGFLEAAKEIQVIPPAAVERNKDFIYEYGKLMSSMAYSAHEARELSREAMQAAISKQDFLANMSHEIRTPMNAVLGMAEMAMREEMSDEARGYIAQIQSSGKHLLAIINDILDYSKIDSGKMEIIDATYDTESLLADVSNVINSRIKDKDIDFVIDIPYDFPTEMYGDTVRLQQIFINLLNNAVKFTSKGYVKLCIDFDPIDDENVMMKVAVEDTGSGIKEDDLGKLFKSFNQVDSKRNRSIEGTGLGLSICKQLVELMNGSISVESEYGKGSTFRFEVPQKVVTRCEAIKQPERPLKVYHAIAKPLFSEQVKKDLAQINCDVENVGSFEDFKAEPGSFLVMGRYTRTDNTEMIREMAEKMPDVTFIVYESFDAPNDLRADNIKPIKQPGHSRDFYRALNLMDAYKRETTDDDDIFSFVAPDAKVLIVDDNAINLMVAKGLLEPLKMQIDTADGAVSCIDKIQTTKYDLIFMDHMMPEVDGVEATHIIRRMYTDYENVPIIALTANAVGGAKEMFIKEGMNDFVAKPIESKKIVAMVRKWLPENLIVAVNEEDGVTEDNGSELCIDVPGLNVENALALLGNKKLYEQFLKEYYLIIDDRVRKINEAWTSSDIKTYTIEVHALKSSSRQIGAEKLADMAAALEKAGNENDIEYIARSNDAMIEEYLSLKDKLSKVFGAGDEPGDKAELTADAVLGIIDEITSALDEFDSLAIEDIIAKFDEYDISDSNELELISEIKRSAQEFEADECIELMNKWKVLENI